MAPLAPGSQAKLRWSSSGNGIRLCKVSSCSGLPDIVCTAIFQDGNGPQPRIGGRSGREVRQELPMVPCHLLRGY
ncbi:hypothetical protein VTI28DRAFT_8044 [Corynascus sepedonium]